MNPVIHYDTRDIPGRLELIAQRIDISVTTPQPRTHEAVSKLPGHENDRYMLKDLAHFIVRGTPQGGYASEIEPIRAVFRYLKNNIEYRQDLTDYDYYMSAGRTVLSGAGDCDDFLILGDALLSSIGYTVGARVISPDGAGWHIYNIAGVSPAFNGIPTRVIPFDASIRPGADDIGDEPPMEYRNYEMQCTFKEGRVVGLRTIRENGIQK